MSIQSSVCLADTKGTPTFTFWCDRQGMRHGMTRGKAIQLLVSFIRESNPNPVHSTTGTPSHPSQVRHVGSSRRPRCSLSAPLSAAALDLTPYGVLPR